jgi:hypothetical protein
MEGYKSAAIGKNVPKRPRDFPKGMLDSLRVSSYAD